MGSLRRPVGPLPSSIYWRRRAVALCVLALVTLLAVWAVGLGGAGGKHDEGGGSNGDRPAPSITPGPSGSGPAISSRPGGRDETGDGGTGTGGTGGEESAGGSGAASGSGGGGGRGAGTPAGRNLPDCSSSGVVLSVRSAKNSYAPDEKPEFRIVAENSSGTACKLDFTRKAASLTITYAGDDQEIWASGDCPRDTGQLLLAVPAGGEAAQKVTWDRKASEPRCSTPRAGSADPGTYLVEARADGLRTARVSFSLKKD
ncbi:hypothetical protein [Streptomyces meridianus]|uniref:Uncharacterized protein n=1 Tax=Streptomyces meridianus TaxID=2938945 RepID=A0ABT0XCY4_9ACTN|nr:hypothetical protein [Streptomyces meridianus]MCM2580377.1 hypothetical protein [Streptomyces meridianus]